MSKNFTKRGQVMILAILALGGTILGATTIAGLLTVYQIRESSDAANSARAIFAADTGIEWGLYQFFHPTSTREAPIISSNGVNFATTCYDSSGGGIDCKDSSVQTIRSVGSSGNARRAFEASF